MAKNYINIFPTLLFFYFLALCLSPQDFVTTSLRGTLPSFCKLYKGIVSSNEALNVLTAGLLQLLYTVTVTVTMHYAACHHLSTVSLMGKV